MTSFAGGHSFQTSHGTGFAIADPAAAVQAFEAPLNSNPGFVARQLRAMESMGLISPAAHAGATQALGHPAAGSWAERISMTSPSRLPVAANDDYQQHGNGQSWQERIGVDAPQADRPITR